MGATRGLCSSGSISRGRGRRPSLVPKWKRSEKMAPTPTTSRARF